MRLPNRIDIARFDKRWKRVRLFGRVTACVFLAAGLAFVAATLGVGEPEAMIPGLLIALGGLAIGIMYVARSDRRISPTYFSVTQGHVWWLGLKVIAHVAVLGYAWMAVGVFITTPWAQIPPSRQTPIGGVIYTLIALVSLIGAILLDCNYFHRPAIEVSARGVTVQYFRRRLYLPLADIGKVALFPEGAGEIRIYPAHERLVQREVRGYFTPSTKDLSMPIYVGRNGVTAQELTDNLVRFSPAAPTSNDGARPA